MVTVSSLSTFHYKFGADTTPNAESVHLARPSLRVNQLNDLASVTHSTISKEVQLSGKDSIDRLTEYVLEWIVYLSAAHVSTERLQLCHRLLECLLVIGDTLGEDT